ncbi:PAS domain S-box protein, partial [Candidatus Bathyarchaeota archaeon]|nr:PAS domain S-box protein [Candidatus Bathyarchaeota archaeon]
MAESIVESSTEAVLNVSKTERTRVLHVDDDQAFLKVAKQCLDTQGEFEVDTASSVNEALEKLKKTDYDAIVSDYQMPGKDGLEFLKELREKGNTVPFIVFTGKGREEVAIKALNLGADQYIDKHGDPETVYCELAHSIENLTRRRIAEEALRHSEAQFRLIVENTQDVVMLTRSDGIIDYVSPSCSKVLGCEPEDLIGKQPWIVHPDDLEEVKRVHYRALKGESGSNVEYRVITKAGQTRWVSHSWSPILKNNEVKLIVSVVKDITERKKAEAALRGSEEKYRNLVENSQDAISIVNFKGNVLFANKAAERLTGYTLKEGKGLNIRVVTPKRYWPKSVAMLLKARMGKPIPYFEYELKRKDGTTVPVETGGQAIFEDGKPFAIQIITREVTERRKAEEALRGSEEKWRSLAENAPNIIVIVDRVGTIQFINRTVVNARPEEIVGKSIYDFIDPQHHNLVKKTIEQVFQTGEGSRYGISGVGPKGSVAWYETHAGPIKHDGQTVAVTLITTDLTERRKMEQQ